MNTINTQKLTGYLSELRHRRKQELDELKNNGKVITGYFCNYTPPELIEACGAIPLRIMQEVNHACETYGRRFVQRDSCSFCKAALGSLIENSNLSCIVSGTTCDQLRRLHEVISNRAGIPTFLFCNPRTYGKKSTEDLFYREILWIIDELTNITGKTFSEKLLKDKVKKWNEIRSFLLKIHFTRKDIFPPLSGKEMFHLILTAFYLGPDRFLPEIPEIEAIITQRKKELGFEPLRILLAGSIIVPDDDFILDLIEDNGQAVIVSDIVCSGVRWFYNPVKEDGNILKNLCNVYHIQTVCPHRRPNEPLIAFTAEQIDAWKPHGIIYRTLKFCHPWSFEVHTFKNKFDVPLLHLDTDYSHSNIGQLRTRIRAFLEMIEAKNSISVP